MEYRIMYIITTVSGEMMIGTEYCVKSLCIDRFVKKTRYTWKQWYRMGARCKKIKVTYEFILKYETL